MKKLVLALFALAWTGVAQPALAQVVSFTGGSSALDGTDGNIRTFSSGALQVQASAWSFDGNALERAFLGHYSTGLGVTNNGEGNGVDANSHTADNVGQSDFVLLMFNQAVNIGSARLTPYDVSSSINDNDALVSYATLAGGFTSPATPLALNSPVWAALLANDYNVAGNMTSPNWTSLNSAGKFGNVWMIGASRPNLDSRDDGFKLTSVSVTPAVPEPATWAMMLFGFGGIGVAMRRGRKPIGRALLQIA